MKGLSILTRAFFISLVPTLIISVLLGTYIIATRIIDMEQEFNLYGKALLSHVVRSSRVGILNNDRQALQDLTSSLLEDKNIDSVVFLNPKHELLAYTGAIDPETLAILKKKSFSSREPSITTENDLIIFSAPVINNNLNLANSTNIFKKSMSHQEIIGWASITFSRANMLLEEYQIIVFTIIFLTLGILFSIFLGRRTARHLTSPLLRMRAAVKKIEQGELNTKLSSTSPGELGELEEGINKMSSALLNAREELQNNVEKATASLKQSLDTIALQNTELEQAQKEALEASRVKSEFIANMSHEIRTPMNGIIGFTNLLLETELSNLQRNYLTTIQKSTLSLLNLVNNILDFSRLDAGQLHLEYLAFDIRECVEEVLTIMSPLANAKQLEFAALIDDDVPHKIISDPLRLKQIIINLASNAIKFTEQGEVIIRVTLEKKTARNAKIRVTISDTGIGLSPGDQKLIFRAFQQADTSIARRYGGTGLGLAICKKLIDQMAGKIGIDNTSKEGSVFWFTFSAERAPQEQEMELDRLQFNNLRICLFENNSTTRLAIRNNLLNWQVNVTDFAELGQLLEYLGTQKNSEQAPHIMIAGINQQISQAMANEHVQTIRKCFTGPLIILTNSSEQAALEFFLSIGAALCLTKPVIRNNLHHAISQLTQDEANKTFAAVEQDSMFNLVDKHILCVDDNVHNANLISALFANTHANITIAHDGHEAVLLAEKQAFDLILMDLRMPKMDGTEALKLIRSSSRLNAKTPVIALSAHIAEHEYQQLIASGFNDYLTKPVMKMTLLKKANQWFQTKSITQAANFLQNEVACIDWDLAIKLAGNKRELAEELLDLFVKNLPTEVANILQHFQEKNWQELLNHVHKLHGAACYCGIPRLKNCIATLETALKQHKTEDLTHLIEEFHFESSQLLKVIHELAPSTLLH